MNHPIAAGVRPHPRRSLEEALRMMGFSSLKSPEQGELISAIAEGKDALGILPTGDGKSACFIIPTLMNEWRTVVISPLKALMLDQVRKLKAHGVNAVAVHGDQTAEERLEATFAFMASKNTHILLYLAPEMMLSDWFRTHVGDRRIDLLAIDEAHCVSLWGNTFRPTYLRIREIGRRLGNPQCVAFSATIDARVEKDIVLRLPIRPGYLRVAKDPYRPNLMVRVRTFDTHSQRLRTHDQLLREQVVRLLLDRRYEGPTIAYLRSRSGAADIYKGLRTFAERAGYHPALFHAQLPLEDKNETLEIFLRSERPLVFATSAFGMGIDRADVRRIIHVDLPYTLLDYAQQIGRGGRDGLPAECVAFFDPSQLEYAETQARLSVPSLEFIERAHTRLRARWLKLPEVERPQLSLGGFLSSSSIAAHQSDKVNNPELYVARLNQAVAILQRVGLITEDEKGLSVRRLDQGSEKFLRLAEESGANARMLARETERMEKFFSAPGADQRLLWKILSE